MKDHKNLIYLDLELPSDYAKLEDPELFFESLETDFVIIDEIQRLPALFPILRGLIDKKKTSKKYLLLGSASPTLIRSSSESLAEKINYLELLTFSVSETLAVKEFTKNKIWLRGAYPLSFLANNDEDAFSRLYAFIHTFLKEIFHNLVSKYMLFR